MADISKLALPNGTIYDIKDAVARAAISKHTTYQVVAELPIASAETLDAIYLVRNTTSGDEVETRDHVINNITSEDLQTNGGVSYSVDDVSHIVSVNEGNSSTDPSGSYCYVTSELILEGGVAYRLTGLITEDTVYNPNNVTIEWQVVEVTSSGEKVVATDSQGYGDTFKAKANTNYLVRLYVGYGMSFMEDTEFPMPTLYQASYVTHDYYDEYITLRSGDYPNYTYAWEHIGSTQGDFANYSRQGHTHTVTTNVSVENHSYKPAGTVSQPTFNGTKATISVSGTPEGTVSKPTFTGTQGSVSVSGKATGTVSKPTFTGTEGNLSVSGTAEGTILLTRSASGDGEDITPEGTVSTPTITPTVKNTSGTVITPYSMSSAGSYTASQWTAGSYTASSYTPETYTVNDEVLTITASSYTKETVTMPTYTKESVTLPSRTQMVITATSSQPTFTGTTAKLSADFTGDTFTSTGKFTPAGTVSQPTFTGTSFTSTGNFTPAGTVSQPTFTGSATTSTGEYTPAGTVTKPTFTGTTATLQHTVNNPQVISGQSSK